MAARIAFICVHNACRSQMAEGFARALGGKAVEAWSAGSKATLAVDPDAVAAMREKGVDIGTHVPKSIEDLPAGTWDYIVTMGCGDACPNVPAKNRLDWDLPDPRNRPMEEFRKVRDEIERRVQALLKQL